MVKYLKTFEEFQKAVSQNICVIDYTATWCGPCKAIAPVFEDIASYYAKQGLPLKFYKVDVDQNAKAAEVSNISAMPTFQVWKDGKTLVKYTLKGANKNSLINMVNKVVSEGV